MGRRSHNLHVSVHASGGLTSPIEAPSMRVTTQGSNWRLDPYGSKRSRSSSHLEFISLQGFGRKEPVPGTDLDLTLEDQTR